MWIYKRYNIVATTYVGADPYYVTVSRHQFFACCVQLMSRHLPILKILFVVTRHFKSIFSLSRLGILMYLI